MTLLSIVVPCFNEEETVDIYYEAVTKVLNTMDLEYEIIKINNNKAKNIEYQSINESPRYYVFYNVDEIINTFAPWDYLYNNEIIITPRYELDDKLPYYNNIDINDILKIQSIDVIHEKIKSVKEAKMKILKKL